MGKRNWIVKKKRKKWVGDGLYIPEALLASKSSVATKLKEISKMGKKEDNSKMKWKQWVGDGLNIPEAEQLRSKSSCISLGFMSLPLISRFCKEVRLLIDAGTDLNLGHSSI